MAIELLTAADYAQRLAAAILARNTKYQTKFGPVADLVIYPLSPALESINTNTRRVESLLSLLNNGDYTHDDLVNFIANEGIRPDIGGVATTTLVFSTARVTSDLTVSAGFPVGIQTSESTSQPVIFVTAIEATLPAAQKSSYFNSATQRYELYVPARCTSAGAGGMVSAQRIVRPLRPLIGFDSVYNPEDTEGGREASTDAELIEQYIIAIAGTDESVANGTQRVMRTINSSIYDSMLVYGNDPLLTRASSDAGAVDIWVICQSSAARVDVATYLGLRPIVLTRQPVLSVVSVSKGATVYTQGADYDLIPDATGYGKSTRARDAILFKVGGQHPNPGDSITIQYTQNSIIEDIQNTYIGSEHLVLGRDLLVRSANQLNVAITANMTVRPGYNPAVLQAVVQSAIVDFVNSTLLKARQPGISSGGYLERSDVDLVVRRISGIDNFIYTKFDLVGGTGIDDIPVPSNSYIRADLSNININIA